MFACTCTIVIFTHPMFVACCELKWVSPNLVKRRPHPLTSANSDSSWQRSGWRKFTQFTDSLQKHRFIIGNLKKGDFFQCIVRMVNRREIVTTYKISIVQSIIQPYQTKWKREIEDFRMNNIKYSVVFLRVLTRVYCI